MKTGGAFKWFLKIKKALDKLKKGVIIKIKMKGNGVMVKKVFKKFKTDHLTNLKIEL